MMDFYKKFERSVLFHCQKPARYTGGEINSVKKDWTLASVKWGLFFPDLYELGISNLGISILYSILNRFEDVLAERFYMPAKDVVEILEREVIPPLSLENKMPAGHFDIIGITLPYELTVSNVLKFLQLSSIKLRARERTGFPVIIGGGSMAFNPLPLVDFFDAFVVGDGEDAVIQISEAFRNCGRNKDIFLDKIAKIEGVFVPSVHNTQTDRIRRCLALDINKKEPGTPIVPFIEATFNRLSIEAARGCTRGCRFCFAGMTTRPYRERNIEDISKYFDKWLDRTGYDEISPASLSISDFSCFPELFHRMHQITAGRNASLSLPSLRVGSILPDIAEKISRFRKTGLTIAPETYPGLQSALNKNVDFDSMSKDVETAFSFGWNNIKLYFMIGLPEEDPKGMYEIKRFIMDILRLSKSARPNITLSFSTFVPKPHTPLQWAKMDDTATILEKQKILKDLFFREKKVYLKLHNPFMSRLEGFICRADEAACAVIEEAHKAGAIFDAWDEHFNHDVWEGAIDASGIDASKYLRAYSTTERLPWGFIDTGVKTEFLASEYDKYFKGITTPDCRYSGCNKCGACDFAEQNNRFSAPPSAILPVAPTSGNIGLPLRSYIMIYEKTGSMRYLGNLDILRLWHRLLRISGTNLGYSKGFNPQPLIDSGWALPLGMESHCEMLKFESEKIEPVDIIEKIRALLPEGLRISEIFEYQGKDPVNKLSETVEFFCHMDPGEYVFDNNAKIMIKKEGRDKVFEIKDYVKEYDTEKSGFRFVMNLKHGGMKAVQFASFVMKKDVTAFDLTKKRILFSKGAEIETGTGS